MGLRSLSRMLLLVLAAALPLSAADITDIEVEVTTDRTFYEPGEEVTMIVTQCNPTDEVITQGYNCPCCHDFYSIVNSQSEEVASCNFGCILVIGGETWQPGECKTRELPWAQLGPDCDFGSQVADGVYRVQHDFRFDQLDYSLVTVGSRFVIGTEPVAVPALSPWALAVMTAALMLAAIFGLARRRR